MSDIKKTKEDLEQDAVDLVYLGVKLVKFYVWFIIVGSFIVFPLLMMYASSHPDKPNINIQQNTYTDTDTYSQRNIEGPPPDAAK